MQVTRFTTGPYEEVNCLSLTYLILVNFSLPLTARARPGRLGRINVYFEVHSIPDLFRLRAIWVQKHKFTFRKLLLIAFPTDLFNTS